MTDTQSRLRAIPQISAVLADERVEPLLVGRRREWVTRLIQRRIDALRDELRAGRGEAPSREELLEGVVADVVAAFRRLTGPAWTRVLNGTGVVVHTNLGRANLPPAAVAAMDTVAAGKRDLDELVGLEFWQVESMIGRPTFDEVKPPARVWTYNSKSCILTILFYPQVGGETFRALTYEVMATEGSSPESAEGCFEQLLTASNDVQAGQTKGTQ
jgi:hypothetical protein